MLQQAVSTAALAFRLLSLFVWLYTPAEERRRKLFQPNRQFEATFLAIFIAFHVVGLFQLCQRTCRRALWSEDDSKCQIIDGRGRVFLPVYCATHVFLTLWNMAIFWDQEIVGDLFAMAGLTGQLSLLHVLINTQPEPIIEPCNVFIHLSVKTDVAFTIFHLLKAHSTMGLLADPSVITLASYVFFSFAMSFATGPDPTFGLWTVYVATAFLTGNPLSQEWTIVFRMNIFVAVLSLIFDLAISIHQGFPWLNGFWEKQSRLRLVGSDSIRV